MFRVVHEASPATVNSMDRRGRQYGMLFPYEQGTGSAIKWVKVLCLCWRIIESHGTSGSFNGRRFWCRLSDGGFIADANGLEALVFGAASTAVNEFKITNAATGSGPILAAISTSTTDSNIDINVTPLGTGNVNLLGDTVQCGDLNAAATVTTNGTGDLILNTNNGTNAGNITLADGANGNITLTANGTGKIQFNDLAYIPQQAITSSSNAVAWDVQAKPNAYHLTTENTTFSAPSNGVEGAFICLEINFNGSHTIGWNTVFEFAASTEPEETATDGKTDLHVFRYNGAIWQEVGRTLNLSES